MIDTETDHVLEALELLAEQFKTKENIEATLSALVRPIQTVEDSLQELLVERAVDTAVGVQLDGIGEIVGQPRNGLEDFEYRAHIKVRIFVNLATGTADDVMKVAELVADIYEPFETIDIEDEPPAAFVLSTTGGSSSYRDVLADLLRGVRGAGINGQWVFVDFPLAETFTLSSDGVLATGDTAQGFADAAQTTGGHMAGVVEV